MLLLKDNIEKKYYSIGEVASMFKVSTSLIRFWESEFTIINPKKNKKGIRQFTQTDIENLRTIYYLVKEKGYTLQGAKDYLKNNKSGEVDKTSIIKSLEGIKSFLLEIRKSLESPSSSDTQISDPS